MKFQKLKRMIAVCMTACVCIAGGGATTAMAATPATMGVSTAAVKTMDADGTNQIVDSGKIEKDLTWYRISDQSAVRSWTVKMAKPGTIHVVAQQAYLDATGDADVAGLTVKFSGNGVASTKTSKENYEDNGIADYQISFTVSKAGTYTIQTSGYKKDVTTVGLTLVVREYGSTTTNTAKAKATTISPTQNKSGLITLGGVDAYWYKFSLASAQRNALTVKNTSADSTIYCQLITPSSSNLGSPVYPIAANKVLTIDVYSPSKVPLNWPKGTYYLKVYRKSKNDSAPFEVSRKAYISAMSISISDQTYTGKALTPSVKIKNGSSTLKKGTDYKVSYSNNKNVGTAKVTIKGIGKYEGTTTKTFQILPKGSSVTKTTPGKKKLTVQWKKVSGISGYQVRYAASKSMKSATTVKAAAAKTKVSCTKNIKSGKKYYVQIRTYKKVGGKTYYSKWSNAVQSKAVK